MLRMETPLSPGALPAANVVGKPPSSCAKVSSPIAVIMLLARISQKATRELREELPDGLRFRSSLQG